ncbi:hypothetical protein KGF54_002728 [Candida jiufengensis]|uniref:uncharacterized protein n=1 Tax=Candida jiufengensis TaxID=497108 RepID=UPI0022257E7B|nr:uncharacterized protein KGF54_002728 [Candida jiufengensis]KAI5953357.1 hypothetical protein KGF54_002728 [Candida jiufengensis]
MSDLIDNLFNTSVQSAVQLTNQTKKPLFVYIQSVNSAINVDFLNKFIDNKSISTSKTNFILLKLIENSTEFEYFTQIYKNLIIPSFNIVKEGKLEAVITNNTTIQEFENIMMKFSKKSIDTINNLSPSSSTSINQNQNSTTTPTINTQNSNLTDHDISVLKHKQIVAQSKKEQLKEKQRLRELLKADQRERESRIKEEQKKHIQEPQTALEKPKSTIEHQDCVLAIKLFDGSTIKKEFNSNESLIDVRKFLDEDINIIPSTSNMPSFASTTYLYPTGYSFHRPTLPRITYTEEQESTSLQALDLTPRSILILKPIYSESQSNNVSPYNEKGIFKNLYKGVGKLGNALMSFFDYGVDDLRNYNQEDSEMHLSPSQSSQQQHQHHQHQPVPEIPPPVVPGFLGIGERGLSSSLLSIHDDRNDGYISESIHSDINIHELQQNSRASSPRYNGNSVNLNERDEDKYN